MEVGKYVNANRSNKTSTRFKGERTFHEVTHSPSTVKPGDTLAVKVPKLEKLLIVPGSLALTFELDVNAESYPVNNLAANIVSRIVIKIGSTPVFDLDHAHLFNTYRDLWLTKEQRKNAVFRGIQDEELRKMRSDLTLSLPNSRVVLRNVYGKRYILPLSFELIDDHVPLSTWDIHDEIAFELTINRKEYVLKYSKAETANFTMNNICLQYETLDTPDLRNQIVKQLEFGFPFLFDHVMHYKRKDIKKNETLLTEDVNIDRKSLKGILLLFQNEFAAGERDSEHFANPQITNVKFTIGTPNKLFNTGYKGLHQWQEICRYFIPEDFKNGHHSFMDVEKYYGDDKFTLWIDLRSTEDNSLHGTGKEQDSKQDIKMEITKNDTGEGKLIMHNYVVSDGRLINQNKKFGALEI
jgi:hypothetical protein